MELTIFTDGGTRGNPGPSAGAFVAFDEKNAVVHERSFFIEWATNNTAEYLAMIAALSWTNGKIRDGLPITKLVVKSDSELIVKQLNGVYRVNSEELRPLYETAFKEFLQTQRLLAQFRLHHIRREGNSYADRLCNDIMDQNGAKFVHHPGRGREK